jgi:hypothetical protein
VSSSYVVNPSLYAKVPYDPYKDFIPLTMVGDIANTLIIHPSVPASSVKELITVMKANPGKYNNFAHAGVGTTPHLSGELFRLTTGRRHGACAVSRRRPGDPVDGRRPHADHVHHAGAGDPAGQSRQPACAGGDGGGALARAA